LRPMRPSKLGIVVGHIAGAELGNQFIACVGKVTPFRNHAKAPPSPARARMKQEERGPIDAWMQTACHVAPPVLATHTATSSPSTRTDICFDVLMFFV
jgi:hypothetical protein